MKSSLLIVFILMTMILVCGCIVSDQNRAASNPSNNTISDNNSLPSNKFVAITFTVRNSGTIVSGQMPITAGAQLPVGFFNIMSSQYDPSSYPSNYPSKNDLKILVGLIQISDSPYHLTTNLESVVGVYKLPCTIVPGLNITSVDANGTVEISYDNETIGRYESVTTNIPCKNESLYAQEIAGWTSPVISERNETINLAFPAIGGTNYTFTIHYKMTYEIENKGVFSK
jgi:hypothetical protein